MVPDVDDLRELIALLSAKHRRRPDAGHQGSESSSVHRWGAVLWRQAPSPGRDRGLETLVASLFDFMSRAATTSPSATAGYVTDPPTPVISDGWPHGAVAHRTCDPLEGCAPSGLWSALCSHGSAKSGRTTEASQLVLAPVIARLQLRSSAKHTAAQTDEQCGHDERQHPDCACQRCVLEPTTPV
jgi:hypothetical protein